jgi:aminopeptidase-like protein
MNKASGEDMYELIATLYPICRSITGNGVRATLEHLKRYIPLTVHEVPSGTPVFDWTVPKEWNIADAYIKNSAGEKLVDFQRCNLHVLNYSVPVRTRLSLAELKLHLFTLPEHPQWIPYRTTYYKETWGFCLSHEQLLQLREEEYEVYIDASLDPGYLTYGEYVLEGETEEEVLITCHVCHPSLCNDNLSGIAVATMLARALAQAHRRYSYRFLFIPGTIGAITWLAMNEAHVDRIKHGFVLAGVGDSGALSYKQSRQGNAVIDRAFAHVLSHSGTPYEIIEFSPYGYDERQFCSPGFDLPVGRFSRTPFDRYPEYHTSADNLDFVTPQSLADSLATCEQICAILEHNRVYMNLNPKCEPQLGKRGLYRSIGGTPPPDGVDGLVLLWVLNLADSQHSLLDIAERAGCSFAAVAAAAQLLVEHGLLQERSKVDASEG